MSPTELAGRVVGYSTLHEAAVPNGRTRWARVTGPHGASWLSVEPLHDARGVTVIRADAVHTIMPRSY